jgi:PIN domain nuclease of toxin-antitoxin system
MGHDYRVILLDTHVVTWLSFEPTRISKRAHSAIRRARKSDGLAISAITLWELAWQTSRGRLHVTGTLDEYLGEVTSRMAVLPLTAMVASLATQFSADYSNDPCDRLIGATALAEGMLLVTKDEKMRSCRQLQTIW